MEMITTFLLPHWWFLFMVSFSTVFYSHFHSDYLPRPDWLHLTPVLHAVITLQSTHVNAIIKKLSRRTSSHKGGGNIPFLLLGNKVVVPWRENCRGANRQDLASRANQRRVHPVAAEQNTISIEHQARHCCHSRPRVTFQAKIWRGCVFERPDMLCMAVKSHHGKTLAWAELPFLTTLSRSPL